jgi:hypothetical protein
VKARLLRARTVAELSAKVEANLYKYRNGDFDHLLVDPTQSFESNIKLEEKQFGKLKDPVGKDDFEVDNCATMLRALPELTPYEAADERLWVMLSHTVLLKHARQRWPIPKKDGEAAKFITTHFFAKSQRDFERNNVGSRLWWMGHLCARVEGMALQNSLELLLFRTDVRANIVERPTTAQSIPVFSALINQLGKSHKGKQKLFERATFRNLMVRLNGLGGYKLLDALERKAVERLIDDVIANDLKISSI